MPGTIQVSVLEFIDLPSSSPPSISIKVSLGKRQYQTWDRGDFSFPLTTLRDNLILTVQDDKGNEIAHAGVEAKSVVEKGLWDDHFPLEGGGHVHMRLKFVLSDDERNRIRLMREFALKKKHSEHLSRNIKSSDNATASGTNLALSFYLNHDFTDSQKCLLQIGELSVNDPADQSSAASTTVNYSDNEKLGDMTEEETRVDSRQLSPNDADRHEVTSSTVPVPQKADIHPPKSTQKESAERPETHSSNTEVPSPVIPSEKKFLSLKSSKSFFTSTVNNSLLPNAAEGKAYNAEEPTPRKKTPSSVRKMISAFESSLSQDTRTSIKSPLRRTQPSVVEKQASLKEEHPNLANKENTVNVIEKTSPYIKRKEDKNNLLETLIAAESFEETRKLPEVKGENLSIKDRVNEEDKDLNKKEKAHEELMRTNMSVIGNVSGRIIDRHSDTKQPSSLESVRHNPLRDSQEKNAQVTKLNKLKSVVEEYSESSRAWIFPDEATRLCITVGGKQVTNLVGSHGSDQLIHSREKEFSHRAVSGIDETDVNKTHKKMRKPEPESSEGIESSEGLISQAIKIAIMVGFGTLVLLTRQKKQK